MTEPYRPPQPRFSAEAMVNIAERLIKAAAGCHLDLSEPDATYFAAIVTRQGAIPREFDAACLSAYRSGRERAMTDVVARLYKFRGDVNANMGEDLYGAGDLQMHALATVAKLIEQWAKAEADGG